jgi:hypothetical protein
MISRDQYIYIDKEELESLKQYLDKKNIQLETEIPDRVLIAPPISVKYHEFDTKKIEDIFFNSVEYKLSNTASSFEMKSDDISVEVKNGVYVTYNNQAISIKQEDVNEKKCIDNAYSFINSLKLNTGNQFTKIKEVGKGYVRLVIGQEYNKVHVDSSQIEIIATEEGVMQAKVNWLESIKPDNRHNIITPVMALLKAYENRGQKDEAVVIKQIRQGYYFFPSTEVGSDGALMLESNLSPMWVIVSDKTEVYINAYNEELETVK